MQTAVTVVNLIHDPQTDTDTPVCWVFPACSWRERIGTTGSGTAKDPAREVHIRIPARQGEAPYLSYWAWEGLSAEAKARAWTLKNGWLLLKGAVPQLTLAEYSALCKRGAVRLTAFADNRERLLSHWHLQGG